MRHYWFKRISIIAAPGALFGVIEWFSPVAGVLYLRFRQCYTLEVM